MKQHPLCVPEIVELIVGHLSQNDLFGCIRASRAMYENFIPALYKTISVNPWHPKAFSSGLQIHQHQIQELTFCESYPTEILSLRGCQSLKTIKFQASPGQLPLGEQTKSLRQLSQAILPDLGDFIAAHAASLRVLHLRLLSLPDQLTVQSEFWNTLQQCSLELSELQIEGFLVQEHQFQPFLEICKTPISLSLNNMILPALPSLTSSANPIEGALTLSGPRHLSLSQVAMISSPAHGVCSDQGSSLNRHGASSSNALLVQMCPNLKSLASHYNEMFFDTRFCATLSQEPWTLTKLDSLELSNDECEDKDIANILYRIQRLRSLKTSFTSFGPLSFQALTMERGVAPPNQEIRQHQEQHLLPRRLCESTEIIHITNCRNVTSAMIQTLLESCPNLESFKADKVKISDIGQGQAWVCHGLKELHIFVERNHDNSGKHSEESMQRMAYNRLATLTKLQKLNIMGYMAHRNDVEDAKSLEIGLSAGLELLGGLKTLREFIADTDRRQKVGVKELAWMKESWPALESFSGHAVVLPSY